MKYKNINLVELSIIIIIIIILYILSSNLYNDHRYEIKLKECTEKINKSMSDEEKSVKMLKIEECINISN